MKRLWSRRGKLLLILFVFVLSTVFSAVSPQVTSAADIPQKYDTLSQDKKARSYAYYRAMDTCVLKLNDKIKANASYDGRQTDPANGFWFGTGTADRDTNGTAFVSPFSGNETGERGCSYIVATAITDYWVSDEYVTAFNKTVANKSTDQKYNAYGLFLHNMGYEWNGSDAWEIEPSVNNDDQQRSKLKTFLSVMGVSIDYSAPTEYYLNQNAFSYKCSPNVLGVYSSLSDSLKNNIKDGLTYTTENNNVRKYAKILTPEAGGKLVDYGYSYYPGGVTFPQPIKDSKIETIGYPLYEGNKKTCTEMVANMNANVKEYVDVVIAKACTDLGYDTSIVDSLGNASANSSMVTACKLGVQNTDNAGFCQSSYDGVDREHGVETTVDESKELKACLDGQGVKAGLGEGVGAITETKPTTTSCVIESIGWLVCGVMGAISGVVDGMYGLIQDILVINPLQQINDDGTTSAQYTTWQNIRNIANVLLVIGFIVIIFSQLTGAGVSNYGIKKLLPRIVLVAIAINLSYIIMATAVDITNVVGVGIKTILDTTGADATLQSVSFEKISEAYLTGATTIAIGATAAAVAIGAGGFSASALALMALPFILGALLSVLAAFVTMFIRNALIIVLVIISPIAFAAYLLPNTQSLFDRWRKLLTSMLVLFPMAALLFGGSRLAAYIIISSGQTLSVLIALFVMVAPLGALPFLIRSSNSILSGINNKLQGAAKMARGATQRGLKPFVDKQRAQYKAGQRNFLGMRQRPGSRNNLAQGFDQRRRSRTLETANAEGDAEQNWSAAGVAGDTGAGRRAQRAQDAQKTLGTRKAANDAQIDERSKNRIATPGTPDAAYEAQTFDAQKGSAAADSIIKQRNFERVQNNAISTSAAGGGVGLGTIDRQQFGTDEATKATELQIRRDNMVSGIAAGAVQGQKAAQDAINIVETQEKAEYAETRDVALVDEAKVASSRVAAAERVEEQEYAGRLQADPSLAGRAGGLDPQGETLVVAQAIETQRKAYDSNVAAYGVRLRQAGTPDSVAGKLGRPDQAGDDSLLGLAMNSARTTEEREAAGRALVAAGNIDAIAPYQDYLATALANAAPGSPEREAVQSLQKAYGETVPSSPGKPMGLGAADIAQFKTGDYLPPAPTIRRPVSLVDLSVSDIQTLNTVNDKGVSMDGWAAMDKSDIARVADLAERGLIEPERLTAMWESLNTALSDVRWYGRIKDREQDKLKALIQPDPVTGISLIPAPPGKTPTPRR